MKRVFGIAIIIFLYSTLSLSQSIRFNHLSNEDGLSSNNVYEIIQDRLGFLWIATDDGLNKFNGYDFKIFRHDPSNKNSLSGNSIWALIEDSKGKIWAGTKNGWLDCYDQVTERFNNWKIESDITGENTITSIYEDNDHFIWIGTYRNGLYRLNPKSGKINHWASRPGNVTTLSNNYISSILQDNEGNMWISTYNGLNKFNPKLSFKNFQRYYNETENSNSISDNIVWALSPSQTDSNLFWIGTANGLTSYRTDKKVFTQYKIPNPDNLQFGTSAGNVIEEFSGNEKILWIDSYAGLVRLNIAKGNFERFTLDKDNPLSLAGNQIHNIIKDRSGVLWIATNNGLNSYSVSRSKFNNILSREYQFINPDLIDRKNIKTIAKTSDNRIWLGTEEGLFSFNNSNEIKKVNRYNHTENLNIWSLTPGNNNELWIGTYGSGIYKMDTRSGRISHFSYVENKYKTPAVRFNKSIYHDKQNNIWIGYWGFGLGRINASTGKYEHWLNEPDKPNSLSHNDVWVIYQDKKGRIWIGTNGGGVNLFDENSSEQFYRWIYEKNNPQSLSSNSIYSICESSREIKDSNLNYTVLWIGTNNGLNKFEINNSDTSLNTTKPVVKIWHYTTKDGLADNSISCIVEDNAGNLWLGTNSGITFYDITKNEFINFNKADGIVGGSFYSSSVYKDKNGIIFMGSTSGLNCFSPNEIKLSNFVPSVLITDFMIFNEPVKVNENSILHSSILYTNNITLHYKQNVFSFQFAALDYSSPQSNQYAYKLEGFDKEWVQSNSRRFVTYTNLNPGEYTFKVKATNSDGIWSNNVKALKVIITPPWWQTPWAIGLYVLIFLLGVSAIIKFQSYRTHLQQELKLQEFEAEHLREIENMKSRFFANLSHEFRTPLMLIKGPLEQLINGRIKENLQKHYQMILRNAEKLQNLIDQLLELSQLEAETIPLDMQRHDLVKLIKGFTYSFIPLAEQKFINLKFNSSVESIIALIDKDKTEKIINNLLSNAFKFTPVGGNINVKISIENERTQSFAKIEIKDSGIGIPEEYQNKIFNRFYRIENIKNENYSGSGIGLALVKELVTLNKWDIIVQSEEGIGTTFTLMIPLKEEFEDENKNVISANYLLKESERIDDKELINDQLIEENLPVKQMSTKPVVLFVEDSDDVRSYVHDLLKQDYEVLLAGKAKVGIELALKNMPELIISDIMMPEMDGIEFCHRIKNDWQTSHIPVIILTAKATEESKIEGLETGADDYLTKPFNAEELFARIKNLIEQRKTLREKFSKEINIKPGTLSNNSIDNEFMKRVLNSVESNLHDSNYNTEKFAEELFVSRRQLHRKLLAITGQTPGEFIRVFRLKRAAQMLIEKNLNVTQIAYEVGFESPAQFTRAFKKHFECLPSEFNHKISLSSGSSYN